MRSGTVSGKRTLLALALLLVSYLFFFYNLGGYSLKEPDEGRYAEIPREMVEQGDWLVPHLDYVRYFEKPPLLYWVTAASYKAFGVGEGSFRFPNALAALLCVLVTYLSAAKWLNRRTGLIAAVMLTTSFGFFAMARIVTIDMLFTFLLFTSLCCFYGFYREKRRSLLYLFYTCLALAVLAKGPVALLLLGATILLFLYFEKRLSFLKDMASASGLLVFCAIAVPWFVAMCVREKEFFRFFFVDQHLLRFLTTKHRRSGPPYYFFPVLFGGLFPWSIFIPRAVVLLWRKAETRLFFLWSLVVFVFFSLSGSKLPPYILPLFPAAAVILGSLFDGLWRKAASGKTEIVVYAIFFACLGLGGLALGFGLVGRYLPGAPETISLFVSIRGLSLGLSAVSFIALFLLSIKGMRTFGALFALLGAFSCAVAFGLMVHAPVIDRLNTTKALAVEARKADRANALVVDYGSFDETLPFYMTRRIAIADYKGELEMGSTYADSKRSFLTHDELARLFGSDRPVLVVAKAKRLDWLKAAGIDGTCVLCQDKRCLIANRSAIAVWRRQ